MLGNDIVTMGPDIRSEIGYMAEYDSLDPGLSAVDQVRYAGELLGMRPDQATQRAHEVLQYVGLQDQRYRKIEFFHWDETGHQTCMCDSTRSTNTLL